MSFKHPEEEETLEWVGIVLVCLLAAVVFQVIRRTLLRPPG